jgi:hypothetical protein
MSLGNFLTLVLASSLLTLGQWLVLKLFGKKIDYWPLFGSMLLASFVMMLLRSWLR